MDTPTFLDACVSDMEGERLFSSSRLITGRRSRLFTRQWQMGPRILPAARNNALIERGRGESGEGCHSSSPAGKRPPRPTPSPSPPPGRPSSTPRAKPGTFGGGSFCVWQRGEVKAAVLPRSQERRGGEAAAWGRKEETWQEACLWHCIQTQGENTRPVCCRFV